MRISGGCGDLQVVQRSLTEAPPAVFTLQLKCQSYVTTADEVQQTLKGIDVVRFSLYTMCSNTQSGSLQCPGPSTGENSLMLLVRTPVHAVRTTQTQSVTSRCLWRSPQALSYLPAPAAASHAHSACLCHPGVSEVLHLLAVYCIFANKGMLTRRCWSWLMCTQVCSAVSTISCRRWYAL